MTPGDAMRKKGSLTTAVAVGLTLGLTCLDAELDRLLRSPAGEGWTKAAVLHATAESLGLGPLYDILAPEPERRP
jgi:hypothetical protein